jgi:uncharacterized protein (TIGR03435 family)
MMKVLLVALMTAGMSAAQTAPQFEVASIKPAAPDERGSFIRYLAGGKLNITNFTLKQMIMNAWGVQPFQIVGGPPWLESSRFDINAKPEKPPAEGQIPLMLQKLLQDRFQLVIRHETREMPIYAIVLARKDGKLGPMLIESKDGACVKYDDDHPPPRSEPGKPPVMGCGSFMMGRNQVRGIASEVKSLELLSRMLGRTVIDKTGLKGTYDIHVEWTPDENPAGQSPAGADRSAVPEGGPSIFTALQEQLGLKLESQKGPVELLMIEKAEKPTENLS